jgi:Restriction endonuclease fold toxin 5
MDRVFAMRRLDARGPASRRAAVDAKGATLGPDCVLVRRTATGYRCLCREDAAAIQKFLFGGKGDEPDRLFALSRGIARALNEGEVALAQIYGLRIPIADLDSGQRKQLAAAAPFAKANFNPDQPRDDHGRWTDQGTSGSETTPLAAPVGAIAGVTAEAAGSIFGALGPRALSGLVDLAAGMAVPTAFLGVLFLPTNGTPVIEGALPRRPDLGYRYDQDAGVLDIYRQDDAGPQQLVTARIGTDGLFHDADGRVLGRSLGSTVAIDPDAPPASVGRTGAEAGAASASGQDRPQLCPDPSVENIAGRSERSLAYQQQITGLPPGLEVKLNGVRFDGCREADGTMLEAKGPGYADKMTGLDTWERWYTGAKEIQVQMKNQAEAATGRVIEWHFAEQPVADYFCAFASKNKLSNVAVSYTPVRP